MFSAFLLAVFFCFPPAFGAEQLSPFAIESLIGKPAPDFTLNDQNGQPVTLSALRGKPVLLNFWAPWAPNSQEEVRTLIRLRSQPALKELVILGITADRKPDAAAAFPGAIQINYPVLNDPGLVVTKERYHAFMVPLTLLIDRAGVVTKIYYGQQDWLRPNLRQQLAEHIGNQPR